MLVGIAWMVRILAILVYLWIFSLCFGYAVHLLAVRLFVARKKGRMAVATAEEGDFTASPGKARELKNFVEGWMRYSLLFTGRIPSHMIRNCIFRHVYGLRMAKHAVLYGGVELRSPHNIEIQEGAIIGDNSILDGRSGLTIGKNANLSTGVWIWTLQHNPQCPDFSCRGGAGRVTIGARAWISCRVVILPGVTIGEGTVVAAGSVVTKNLEPFTIYGGIPAKKIGTRNRNIRYEFDGSHLPFF